MCVTSSNAVKIVSGLPQQHVLFIPDQNLGRFVAEQVPQKHVILNNGYCPRHHIITVEQIVDAQEAHPDALVLAHPECKADVLAEADYIGSTAGIIKYAEESDASEFIIVTVRGVLYELERRCQGTGKKFYFPAVQPTCVNMDLITLEKLVHCLETGEGEVQIGVSDEAADQANSRSTACSSTRRAKPMRHEGQSLCRHYQGRGFLWKPNNTPTWSAMSSLPAAAWQVCTLPSICRRARA